MPGTSLLEAEVTARVETLSLDSRKWKTLQDLLVTLKGHHLASYQHSLRVGLYSFDLATYENLDPILPFLSGLSHDLGKRHTSVRLLDAKHLTEKGYCRIKLHSHKSYQILLPHFPKVALVAGLHHRPINGYGIDLAETPFHPLPKKTLAEINSAVDLVAICDFFDALTTRNDQKNRSFLASSFGIEGVLNSNFQAHPKRVTWLLENRLDQVADPLPLRKAV